MSRALRLLIVWVLAAALPLQAIAGASLACCGSGHATDGAAHDAHEPDVSSDPMDAHHPMAADAPDEPDHHRPHGKAETPRCSLCAACATTALPPARLSLNSGRPLDRFAVVAEAPIAPFLTAGPERPPRPFPS